MWVKVKQHNPQSIPIQEHSPNLYQRKSPSPENSRPGLFEKCFACIDILLKENVADMSMIVCFESTQEMI